MGGERNDMGMDCAWRSVCWMDYSYCFQLIREIETMYWIVVIIIVAICTLTGFLVGVAYGQENWHEHL